MKKIIIFSMIIVGVGLSIISAVITNNTITEQNLKHSRELLEEVSALTADKLDIGIFERFKDIQVLSTLESIRDPQVDNDERRELLDQLKVAYSDYAFIAITDTEGKVLVSAERLLEGENVSQRPWFIETMKGEPFVGDVHEALLLARLIPNLTGEPLRFVDVAFPLRDEENNITGVLGTHLSWTWANEVRDSIVEVINDTRDIDVFILSSNKDILLGTNDYREDSIDLESVNLALSGSAGSRVETWSDGVEYVTAYQPTNGYRTYEGIGWIVLARERLVPVENATPIVIFGLGITITLFSVGLSSLFLNYKKKNEIK